MAVLSERDAIAWHRLAGRIAEVTEPRLSRRVLANRIAAPGPRWALEPVGPALGRARTAARRLGGPLVIRTDVAGFYPSVIPSALFRALRRLGVLAEEAGTAADMLEGWGSDGYPGLPIGPPGSAVLGNAVLASVDAEVDGHSFLRWVDDYLIAVPTERAAVATIERIDAALHRLGLRRAVPKTHLIGGPGPVRWLGASTGGP
jgi:reverse transcriptase-like protein